MLGATDNNSIIGNWRELQVIPRGSVESIWVVQRAIYFWCEVIEVTSDLKSPRNTLQDLSPTLNLVAATCVVFGKFRVNFPGHTPYFTAPKRARPSTTLL